MRHLRHEIGTLILKSGGKKYRKIRLYIGLLSRPSSFHLEENVTQYIFMYKIVAPKSDETDGVLSGRHRKGR